VDEARAIASTLGATLNTAIPGAATPGTATLLSGAEATVSAVQQQAGQFDTVHLACHGLFRADNPMFSSLRLHDGWLMAADIARLRLNGASLIFSACESGRNQVTRGDEVYGLVRAALSAGAASVVASLWLVHDQTTAALMESWYNNLSHGLSRATALRQSQLAVRATQPHPYFWAPFVLIGKR
jgi:CHAT domain-containing protein